MTNPIIKPPEFYSLKNIWVTLNRLIDGSWKTQTPTALTKTMGNTPACHCGCESQTISEWPLRTFKGTLKGIHAVKIVAVGWTQSLDTSQWLPQRH